jgi:hypothetical protein
MKIRLGDLKRIIREAAENSGPLENRTYVEIGWQSPAINFDGTPIWNSGFRNKANPGESLSGFMTRHSLENPEHFPYDGEEELGVHFWLVTMKDRPDVHPGYVEAYEREIKWTDRQKQNVLSMIRKRIQKTQTMKASGTDKLPPEGTDDDVFGKYAFAGDGRRQDVPDEDDTEIEKKLFNDIYNVIWGIPGSSFDGETIQTYKDSLRAGKYKKALNDVTPSKSAGSITNAYRGMYVDEEWLRSALGLNESDPLPDRGSSPVDYTYKSQYAGVSSWSWDKSIAEDSAEPDPAATEEGKTYSIVMHAAAGTDGPNTFVHVTKLMYTLIKPQFSNERESIGVGDIAVNKIEWKKAS